MSYVIYGFLLCYNLGKGLGPFIKKALLQLPDDALYQIHLELAKLFWRKIWNYWMI